MFEHVRSNTLGAPHMCQFFWCQSCLLVKITKTSKNKLVESMHYCNFRQCILVRPSCIFYILIVDKNWTEHCHLAFHFDLVGRPHTFFRTGPPHLLIRPLPSICCHRSCCLGMSVSYSHSLNFHCYDFRADPLAQWDTVFTVSCVLLAGGLV